MVKINSYVFFDIETTGLPHQERNRTKIIELSLVASVRRDLEEAAVGSRPYVSKLTLLINPERKLHSNVELITGINNDMLKNAPVLREKSDTILTFLNELQKPVCLVAHNGNNFDYKILLAEFADIKAALPKDLLCVDSLVGFRRMHKEKYPIFTASINNFTFEDSRGSEDWPDLDISCEDWNDIELLCSSFSQINPFEKSQGFTSNKTVNKIVKETEKISFTLPNLYKSLLKKDVINSHRAEDDCLALLECVVVAKEFLIWTDKYCRLLHDIKPLERK